MKPTKPTRYATVAISHEAHDALLEIAHRRRDSKKNVVEQMIDDETKKEAKRETSGRR